jgi:hypothetical protein
LEESFNLLIEKHDSLRNIFLYKELDDIYQVVTAHRKLEINFEDISSLPQEQRKTALEKMKESDWSKGYDFEKELLIKVTLIKTGNQNYELFLSHHHIILDGWGLGIVFKYLIEFYRALQTGREIEIDTGHSYRHFTQWLESRNHDQAIRYWNHYLKDYKNPPLLSRFSGTPVHLQAKVVITSNHIPLHLITIWWTA